MKRLRGRAFTLIELLVVIAIIALLISILLPALGRARNAGRLAVSLSNVRQINIGMATYRFEKKDQVPYRSGRYANGVVNSWDTWHYGGKNCSKFWQTYAGGVFDETAYSRPLNPQIYGELVIEKPSGYVNNNAPPATWTLTQGTPSDQDRDAVQMPVFRSPGDKATRQRAWPTPDPTISSYDDVGTSYHSNMKWFYQPGLPAAWNARMLEGSRRIRLASEYDPTGKFVWIHDQTADIIAHSAPTVPYVLSEFGDRNKSVAAFLDGRASYITMKIGKLYDGEQINGRWVVTGQYTFIFQTPGNSMPPP
jgi:prepilin-type N-terminal cleavage/methylation domain-containing protein